MVDPASVPEAARDPHGALGSAAIAEYITDREFGRDRRVASETELDLIQDAIEGFITYEQWLPLEHDEVELIARLRIAASITTGAARDVGDLLGRAADALTELGQRLALQRHSREIMTEGLVLQGEALKQAQLGNERAAWRSKSATAPDAAANGGTKLSLANTAIAAIDPPQQNLSLYRIKFWRRSITADRMSIEVVAISAEAARTRVVAWGMGDIELTPQEEATEALEREERQDSSFDRLLDAGDPYAVTLLGIGRSPLIIAPSRAPHCSPFHLHPSERTNDGPAQDRRARTSRPPQG